jgi:hypothetical protein
MLLGMAAQPRSALGLVPALAVELALGLALGLTDFWRKSCPGLRPGQRIES